jgi:hypothetical protein
MDLSWNNVNNPHSVIVCLPESTLGPFQNIDDGKRDGRIFLEISSDSTLTPGTWYYVVRADRELPGNNETLQIYREDLPDA